MAPTFYHYWPVPVTDKSESMLESQRLGRLGWLCILLILMVVALLVAVITLGIRVNSKACKDGLLAEQECCNATRLLELRLTQTQQDLLETMDQAATCNQTAMNLSASLEKENARGQKQLIREKELQGEIERLKQELQDALEKVERLRKEKEVSSKEGETSFGSSLQAFSPLTVPVYLLLGLLALLA
ncbi:bone marrow stromal antigen 2 [Ursus americanus]|uniref:Bone marrow stromal antigen 2 n=2 Tax=Ursus TaxID=9639 RepID=A0A384D602_URSMA|nr:bone marrow stromal antigen 2 [Ursus maritimus]XP_026356266.1 bone marrow stromal antigen 2 [Ursus arctos]XP_040485000.1 bone marrow stromal antigen 2 [Ursus maritimus]XP_045634779.1 bone marrow stromal antigen 2 [Ursus americanus]